MKSLNLKGKQRKNVKYYSYKGEVGKITDNILKRDFYEAKPLQKLTTDVTELKYVMIKYIYHLLWTYTTEKFISYFISLSLNLEQIRRMLSGLFDTLPADARPLFHSDQGWQYQHAEYQRLLLEHNITQSM